MSKKPTDQPNKPADDNTVTKSDDSITSRELTADELERSTGGMGGGDANVDADSVQNQMSDAQGWT